MMHVLVQVEDSNNVGASWNSAVQLNLPPGFGSVVEDLLIITNTHKWHSECSKSLNWSLKFLQNWGNNPLRERDGREIVVSEEEDTISHISANRRRNIHMNV